jgi:hypothetical protein
MLRIPAAWYFIFIVYRFWARRAKNDTQRIENDRQAKVLDMLFGLFRRLHPGAHAATMAAVVALAASFAIRHSAV